ncbi:MAG: hypothetical protein IKL92_02530 [Oscillospiraceae bacterium]|nr:hypothetical protein [Oscillospiraceae bacterium]
MNGFSNKFSRMQTDAMLKMASQKLKKAPDEVKTALEKGDVSALTGSLNEADRQKVNAVLSDPAAMRKILSDPKVKELLKSFESGR